MTTADKQIKKALINGHKQTLGRNAAALSSLEGELNYTRQQIAEHKEREAELKALFDEKSTYNLMLIKEITRLEEEVANG